MACGVTRWPPTSRNTIADFTEMTTKLRSGIFWSDGVEFTADDVMSTVMTQIKNPGMRFSAVLTSTVASVDAPDPYTVVFKLKKPNSRFHTNFTVRWNAIWIYAKACVREGARPGQSSTSTSRFARRLRAEQLRSRRQMVHLAIAQRHGSAPRSPVTAKPGPKYLAYVDPGPPDNG